MIYNAQGQGYWQRKTVTDEERKKYRSQAASNESSLRGEIAGLFRPDRCTLDHVAPILTGDFLPYLYSLTNDDHWKVLQIC